MEQARIQASSRRQLSALLQSAQALGADASQVQGDNPFFQIIQNMMEQMGEGSFQAQDAELSQPSQTQEQQTLLQSFAAMLFALPNAAQTQQLAALQALQAQDNQVPIAPAAIPVFGTEAFSSTQPPLTDAATALQMLASEQNAAGQGGLSGNFSTVATVQALASQSNAATAQSAAAAPILSQSAQGNETSGRAALRTSLSDEFAVMYDAKQTPGSDEGRELLSAQRQFMTAVGTAKQALAEQPEQDTDAQRTKLDIDKLQAAIDLQKSPRSEIFDLKTAAEPQPQKLLDQLSTGISANLKAGKSDFTMKLKPETLGEITVKLMESGGKLTLHITTATSQTAKLINADLAALREAVRPMQVEVHEAVQSSSESAQSQMHQYSMSGQQFSDQHQAFTPQQKLPHYGKTDFYPSEEESFASLPVQQAQSGALNVYI